MEAIVLAEESKADWLLIGMRGWLFAGSTYRFTGDWGFGCFSSKGKLDGRLERVRPELGKLRSEAHFFIGKELELQILSAIGER